jgi:hypothetical protein
MRNHLGFGPRPQGLRRVQRLPRLRQRLRRLQRLLRLRRLRLLLDLGSLPRLLGGRATSGARLAQVYRERPLSVLPYLLFNSLLRWI